MTKCPQCHEELKVPNHALLNADAYGPNTVATLCCGRGVRVNPVRSYSFTAFEPDCGEDDWGVSFANSSDQQAA